MHLHEATVDRYGPLAGCSPTCGEGLTVISGPNESGKTLFLEAVVQLLDPAVADVLDPPLRVDQRPTGRVVLEHDGERYGLPGEMSIGDLAGITPSTLRTVFVVRDTDLAMPDDEGYYTRLIEHLGDIHTSEIDELVEELLAMGRLTKKRMNLSTQYDDAKETTRGARTLVDEIEAYLERIESEGLDELHGERLRVERELRDTEDELRHQRHARAVFEHDRLDTQLETYREANERLDALEVFTPDALESLRETRRAIERHERRLEELDERETRLRGELTAAEERRDELERAVQRHETRAGDVDAARDALARYRRRMERAPRAERELGLAKRAVLGGIVGAGLVGGAGAFTGSIAALGVAAVLLILTLVAGGVFYRANATLSGVEADEATAVAVAQDAGLEVDGVDEVPPAIESFESRLDGRKNERAQVAASIEHLEDDLADTARELTDVREHLEDAERSLRETLETAGVEDIDAFQTRVERRSELERECDLTARSLQDAFGEPDADDWSARAVTWEDRLDQLVADVDTETVDPELFDEDRLADLETTVEDLRRRREQLDERLSRYDDRLDELDRAARELTASPFLDRTLGLDSRSPEGLEQLRDDLETLLETIERDAEHSRRAIEVLEEVRADETQKLTTLFDPEGPASQTFERITHGRYTEVAYDATDHRLVATRADGRELPASRLSQGTRDQLYFASRVSLATQLLGGEPGFFLLDDPLVTADPDRLEAGFETLLELADEGWQVLYLTAKEEVYRDMVEELALPHERLDVIE